MLWVQQGTLNALAMNVKKAKKADPENTINIIYFEIDTAQFSG